MHKDASALVIWLGWFQRIRWTIHILLYSFSTPLLRWIRELCVNSLCTYNLRVWTIFAVTIKVGCKLLLPPPPYPRQAEPSSHSLTFTFISTASLMLMRIRQQKTEQVSIYIERYKRGTTLTRLLICLARLGAVPHLWPYSQGLLDIARHESRLP